MYMLLLLISTCQQGLQVLSAPYFWQNEKTGEATGDIEIVAGDTIVWKNGDQALHAIDSGTNEDGPDGVFSGGTLGPGDFYAFTFSEKGQYPYYCLFTSMDDRSCYCYS